MKILFFTGDHPRHLHMAAKLADTGWLAGLVLETREAHLPELPAGLPAATKALFERHFRERAEAEARHLGDAAPPDVPTERVSREELNSEPAWRFIEATAPDVLLSYGVHKLADETLDHAPGECWNIHGGLSPWYRGVATHFWPSYMLEPQVTGMTVHELSQVLDGGKVVHQNVAELVRGDGVHDLACRAVGGLAAELPQVLTKFKNTKSFEKRKQRTSGKLWLARDFHPAHLHLIYDTFGNRIVDRYLDGELNKRDPELFRQL